MGLGVVFMGVWMGNNICTPGDDVKSEKPEERLVVRHHSETGNPLLLPVPAPP